MSLIVHHWGTRGSISAPSADQVRFGAATPCVTVCAGTEMIILDAGYGITTLGQAEAQVHPLSLGGCRYHLFLTHFHWDHIQGLPFFAPSFFQGNEIHIWSPLHETVVRQVLDHLFDGSYTPFDGLASLPCLIKIHRLHQRAEAHGFVVSACSTAHVGPTYAYRIERDGLVIVYAPDHDAAIEPLNERFLRFAAGADLLIHDSTYTAAEYEAGADWVHSAMPAAVQNARRIAARHTHLTHHAPLRKDIELEQFEIEFGKQVPGLVFAREWRDYLLESP